MVKFLFSLLLLLGTSNALAQICIWDGSKYNTTCWACATGSTLPDWWKTAYCGAPVTVITPTAPTCKTGVETRQESCLAN
jgi:hypothetical protein